MNSPTKLSLLYLGMSFASVYLFVWQNNWQRSFYDALEKQQGDAIGALLLVSAGIMASQVAYVAVSGYVQGFVTLRWRVFLTRRYLGRWLARDRYTEIERLRLIDNPDQRISEDIRLFTQYVPQITIGLISSFVSAITFTVILARTAGTLRFTLLGYPVILPSGIIIGGYVYALAGAYITVLVGRLYVRSIQRQQHREADFRAGMIHVRRNAAQIGLVGTVEMEARGLHDAFRGVCAVTVRVIYGMLGINLGQGLFQRIGSFVPYIFTIPAYLGGRITFGQVMSTGNAFDQLVGGLSYFIQSYSTIGQQVAGFNRLKGLDDAIDAASLGGIVVSGDLDPDTLIATRGLVLARPAGGPLLTVCDWTVRRGERWVVQGPSGIGKSTLLRAIAGLWPDGEGEVAMARAGRAMIVPQRLYMPLGTLKDAICFPDAATAHGDTAIVALLDRVGLAAHAAEIHAVRQWQEELSPGEQQRIALARILLQQPDFILLDEATSALDPDHAMAFYSTMLESRSDVTLVSIVHDERLSRFHTHHLVLEDGRAVARPLDHA